jgi:hypothetical protein
MSTERALQFGQMKYGTRSGYRQAVVLLRGEEREHAVFGRSRAGCTCRCGEPLGTYPLRFPDAAVADGMVDQEDRRTVARDLVPEPH